MIRLDRLNVLFGALLGLTGLYFAAAGPAAGPAFGLGTLPAPGGDGLEVPGEWRLVGFVRMFGGALLLGGLILWSVGRSLDPARVRAFAVTVAGGASLAAALAFSQQTALWNTSGGWTLTALFALMALAYGAAAVTAAAPARDPGSATTAGRTAGAIH